MSPLDAARNLAGDTPIDYAGHDRGVLPTCWYCERSGWEGDHADDCPILALPRIVAALEAAVQFESILKEWPEGMDIYGIWTDWTEKAKPHIEALVAAMAEPSAIRR